MRNKKYRKVPRSQVRVFKIRNRRGYAAVCLNNLTEGSTISQAFERMNKALRRKCGCELQ